MHTKWPFNKQELKEEAEPGERGLKGQKDRQTSGQHQALSIEKMNKKIIND